AEVHLRDVAHAGRLAHLAGELDLLRELGLLLRRQQGNAGIAQRLGRADLHAVGLEYFHLDRVFQAFRADQPAAALPAAVHFELFVLVGLHARLAHFHLGLAQAAFGIAGADLRIVGDQADRTADRDEARHAQADA